MEDDDEFRALEIAQFASRFDDDDREELAAMLTSQWSAPEMARAVIALYRAAKRMRELSEGCTRTMNLLLHSRVRQ